MCERFRHCPSSGVSVICEFACCLDDDKKSWYFETRRRPLTWEKHPCHSLSLPVTVAQLDSEKLFVSGKYKCIQVLCDLDTRSGLLNTPEAFDKSFRQKEYQILSHAIDNTTNQKARNPVRILRYARGSQFDEKKNRRSTRPTNFSRQKIDQYLFIFLIFFFIKIVFFQETLPIRWIVFAVKALTSDVLC